MQYQEEEYKVTPKIIRLLQMYLILKNYGGIEYSSLIQEEEGGLKFSKKTFEKDIQCMRKAGLMIRYSIEYKNYILEDNHIMKITEQNAFIIKVNRLYQIINHIQETYKFTKEWYQDTFHLSTRTMTRDLSTLRYIHINIKYCFFEEQYEIYSNGFD